MLTVVANPKTKMINVRLAERMHEDFKIACELRGASMSSLLHQFVVRTIREEKELSPRSFLKDQKANDITNRPTGARLSSTSPHKLGVYRNSKEKKKKAG
jgi:hypothetical protein